MIGFDMRIGFRARRTVVLMAAAFVAMAPAARAGGGAGIASAPLAPVGPQVFGTTSTGSFDVKNPAEYWGLPLLAGDKLWVDWDTVRNSFGYWHAARALIYPPGTTDATAGSTSALVLNDMRRDGHSHLDLVAPRTAVYPLVFISVCCRGGTGENGGPYDFILAAWHAAVVTVGRVDKLARRGRGTVVVHARMTDGRPVTTPSARIVLTGRWGSHTRRVGVGPVVRGIARLRVALPRGTRGRRVSLRASLQADSFLPARSRALKLRVRKLQGPGR